MVNDARALTLGSFDDMVIAATGHSPYAYQCRMAMEGLPGLLRVPTGGGKTLAATLPWLYRRRFHPDPAVRSATPRWLVLTLPMRVLVEQTFAVVQGWLQALDLADNVGLHLLMGGESRRQSRFRTAPERDAVIVGTLDMILSRALNRGYGESRWSWPLDFGLFNNGCHYVFDEVQLMGPGLPTSRQLHGLREALGTALPCSSTWMSATVAEEAMHTVDASEIETVVELAEDDRRGPLATRLNAGKTVRRLTLDPKRYAAGIAQQLCARAHTGRRLLAVLNTVDRAVDVYHALAALDVLDVVLVHSRFRPRERAARVAAALAEPGRRGLAVVSTQVLEAGVDVSADVLFTEAAPWPSIVQRAGRCNRDGSSVEAELLWAPPPAGKAAPYDADDVAAAAAQLDALEDVMVTAGEIGRHTVPTKPILHAVLRRRDLVQLFDTAPDLSGNDIDVARFIRENDDLDVYVAWSPLAGEPPHADAGLPGRDERCPVPLGALRDFLKQRVGWRFDHRLEAWVRLQAADVRPGMVVVLPAAGGGYSTTVGWSPASREPVPLVDADEAFSLTDGDTAVGDDPATFVRRWLSLQAHLADVEREVRQMATALRPWGLTAAQLEAAAVAGRLHDVGKAHPAFQQMLEATAITDAERRAAYAAGQPWAKSGGSRRGHHVRPHFRHELASALALLGDASVALDGVDESDLAVYLVAAHHGRVRLGIRSMPDERPPANRPDATIALGVIDGDQLPATAVPGMTVPASTLDLSVAALGDNQDDQPSWSRRALALRDRADLGPFRLAFLEALVRLADWNASAIADQGEPIDA